MQHKDENIIQETNHNLVGLKSLLTQLRDNSQIAFPSRMPTTSYLVLANVKKKIELTFFFG